MPTKEMQRWEQRLKTTLPLLTEKLTKPIAVVFLEAENHKKFVTTYWEPAADGSRPGLVTASSLLDRSVVDELDSLLILARDAHSGALFMPESSAQERARLMGQGEGLLTELGAGAELVLDDGVTEPADEAFAAAGARAATDASIATFIQSLIDYANIAESLQDRLSSLPGFDLNWIPQARQVAESLNALGAPMLGRAASPQIDVRNRAMTLIDERCRQIDKVSNYVFRHHPEVLRQIQSAYTRRKNLAARRRKLAQDVAQTPS